MSDADKQILDLNIGHAYRIAKVLEEKKIVRASTVQEFHELMDVIVEIFQHVPPYHLNRGFYDR